MKTILILSIAVATLAAALVIVKRYPGKDRAAPAVSSKAESTPVFIPAPEAQTNATPAQPPRLPPPPPVEVIARSAPLDDTALRRILNGEKPTARSNALTAPAQALRDQPNLSRVLATPDSR